METNRPRDSWTDTDHRQRNRITRRELVLRSGATLALTGLAPAVLAACGGGTDETTTQPAATADADTTAAGDSVATAPATEVSGTIDFLSWEGYDLPEPMEAWKTETGVELNPTYIANHDEIQAKIKAGGGGAAYDIITYASGYRPLYSELEILEPIDESKIPNLENLYPFFASDIGNWWITPEGTRTGVPWTWGAIGLTYDSAVLPDGLASWYDLLDPKYTGEIIVPDDPLGSYSLVSHILGVKPDEMTEDVFEQANELLSQIIAQSQGVAPTYGDVAARLVAGEGIASWHGWAAVNKFALDAGKDTIKTMLPAEGGYTFCDSWAVPPTVDNVEAVYGWINQTLTPEVNAQAAIGLVGGVTVADAVPLLDEVTASLYPYDDLDSFFEIAPLYNAPPSSSDQYVTVERFLEAWQELKAGS